MVNVASNKIIFSSGDKLGKPPDNVMEARNDMKDGREVF